MNIYSKAERLTDIEKGLVVTSGEREEEGKIGEWD